MKKTLFAGMLTALLSVLPAAAQDTMMFNHLAVGAEVGTTGFGLEVAAPISNYATLRTGFTTMPTFSYKDDVDYTSYKQPETVEVEGKLHMTDWKLLADFYPIRNNSFHITAGFYVGKSELISAKNNEDIKGLDDDEGIEIGDYLVKPDENGVAHARLKVGGFKPYLGIGFGRVINPEKKVTVSCDLGVQFWGKPKLQAYSDEKGGDGWVTIHSDDSNDDDLNKALDKISGIKVWPVLNVRVYFNAF